MHFMFIYLSTNNVLRIVFPYIYLSPARKDIKTLSNISGLANQHATYYYLVYAEIIKHTNFYRS